MKNKPKLYYVVNPRVVVVSMYHDNEFWEHITLDETPWVEDGIGFGVE